MLADSRRLIEADCLDVVQTGILAVAGLCEAFGLRDDPQVRGLLVTP
ncbi:MAG: hypothetical protein JWP87_2478 [Labilithrix sp.]|nr:hypothetical protein [Labilithrix sp.]